MGGLSAQQTLELTHHFVGDSDFVHSTASPFVTELGVITAWGGTLSKASVVAGMDANEAFPDPDQTGWRAGTAGNYHGRRSTPWPEHTTTQPGDNRTTPTASARRLPHRRAHFKEGSRHLARSDS